MPLLKQTLKIQESKGINNSMWFSWKQKVMESELEKEERKGMDAEKSISVNDMPGWWLHFLCEVASETVFQKLAFLAQASWQHFPSLLLQFLSPAPVPLCHKGNSSSSAGDVHNNADVSTSQSHWLRSTAKSSGAVPCRCQSCMHQSQGRLLNSNPTQIWTSPGCFINLCSQPMKTEPESMSKDSTISWAYFCSSFGIYLS